MGQEGLRQYRIQPITLENERRETMPILLWLVGIPIPIILLILLLR